jgi:nucleoside-diphosphate-sugar epimerase
MKIFVAGGTGAVGRRVIPLLVTAGHAVVALTRQPERAALLRRLGAEAVVGDVFDRERLIRFVRDASPDAIINQLTDLPSSMNPRELKRIYAANNRVRREGTGNLIAAAHAAGTTRMVAQSMATWYRPGVRDPELLNKSVPNQSSLPNQPAAVGVQPVGNARPFRNERDPLWTDAPEPIGEAVRTVAAMENAVVKDMPIGVVLRYGAFYGPGTWYATDGEIGQRLKKRGFPVVGNGSGVTSFIHVDDAASAAVVALRSSWSAIYNIVDDEPAAASEWMPVYARALGADPPRRVPAFLARLVIGTPLTEWITTMEGASNREARTRLGWAPQYPTWRYGFGRALAEDARGVLAR